MSEEDEVPEQTDRDPGRGLTPVPRRNDEFQAAELGAVSNRKEIRAAGTDGTALTASQQSTSLKASFFAGPIPKPEIFRQYEEICPGAADRIIRMAEDEGTHRRAMERTMGEAAIATERRGQVFGFCAVVAAMAAGCVLLLLKVDAVGVSIVIGSFVSLIAAGIWNRYSERKQLQLEERKVQASEEAIKQAAKDSRDGKRKKR